MTKDGKTPTGKQRWGCYSYPSNQGRSGKRVHCYSTTSPGSPAQIGQNRLPKGPAKVFRRAIDPTVKRFIVTAAQNATPVHDDFWDCLTTAAKHLSAELLVVPIRYKNPNSRWSEKQETDEWWAKEIQPYLWNARRRMNENLLLLGDIKTVPTASEPLTGFESISGTESCILGHTKLQLKTVATPSSKMAKILTTTGACTVANYTDSKAGKLGEFHHSLSAVLVETYGKLFWLRQLHYDARTHSITDLRTRFHVDSVVDAPRPSALVLGDTHVDFVDPMVESATDDMVGYLQPEHIAWHDLLDGYSANPHHFGNPFNAIAKRQTDRDDVRAEVFRAIDYVKAHTPKDCRSVIVSSNHDDFLRRWVVSNDWKMDPTNAEFYLETALAMVRGTKLGPGGTEYPSPFPYWVGKECAPEFVWCIKSGTFVLNGVELGMHGDRGPNGSKGSIKNLRRIGVKSIIGHTHSPGINEGCYQTGTSTRLQLEYTAGPSGWLNTHCVLHANGKRQLITIINGRWRL
jgi:hypothetical protein